MGKAKIKHKRHADILRTSLGCIYCAAENPSTQIDHMPPRVMFRVAQRPKGLEFPSCADCNQGTSKLDLVAAFMARTFPGVAGDKEDVEWGKLLREVTRAVPGLLEEMWMPQKEMADWFQQHGINEENLAAFRANGPILSAYMQAFAAKIGFALHYEATGNFVPAKSRVQVRWFTSGEIFENKLPDSLKASVKQSFFLRQGKITSEFQFEYGWGPYANDTSVRLYYARVRDSFIVAAFVAENPENLPFDVGELATFAPGDLRKTPFDRIFD